MSGMLGRGAVRLALLCVGIGAPAHASAAGLPPPAEPSAPPARRVEERGESPYYYRRPKDTLGWGYRVGLGSRISLASTMPRPVARFTLDVLPELDFGFARGSTFGGMVQGGYSYARDGLHLFVLGAGPALRGFGPKLGGQGRGIMTAALLGHGVVGTLRGEPAAGVRTTALFHVLALGIEVGHQYVVAGPQHAHELRIMVGLGIVGFSTR
jgi:hypothetical protein